MNQRPSQPDWIRLEAAISEVMAAIDCEPDPSLHPKALRQFHEFRTKVYRIVEHAAKVQKALEQTIQPSRSPVVLKSKKSSKWKISQLKHI
jgi:hypothetical protein